MPDLQATAGDLRRQQWICYLVLGVVAVALFSLALNMDYRRMVDYLFGDEAVYMMMAQSLAHDQDLTYNREDLQRFYASGWESGPQGVFLSKRGSRLYYSKFLVYPAFLSPFIALFGNKGFVLFNAVLFLAAAVLAFLHLSRYNPPYKALLFALGFFFLSASTVYVFWTTPEIFNLFAVSAGLFFFTWYVSSDKLFHLLLAGVCIAIAAASKLPNAVFALGPGLLALQRRQWRNVVLLVLLFVAAFGSFYGLQYVLTGDYNAYAGDRKTFYWHYPYEKAGAQDWERGTRLSNEDYFEESFYFNIRVLLLNAYYYLMGRFTGLLPYFAFSVCALLIFCFSRKHGPQTYIFLSALLMIAAFIVMAPDNYQGGGGAVGNRFFLNIYPAFLFMLRRIRGRVLIALTAAVACLFLAPVLVQPFYASFHPAVHTFGSPAYRMLPVEYTLLNTLPTMVNRHMMDAFSGHRVYHFNENGLYKDNGGYWVKGNATWEMAVRSMQSDFPEHCVLTLQNGLAANKLRARTPAGTETLAMYPGRIRSRTIALGRGYPYFKTRSFPFSVHSDKGFVPCFHQVNLPGLNTRYLGCFVHLSFAALDIARGLLRQGDGATAKAYVRQRLAEAPQDLTAHDLMFACDAAHTVDPPTARSCFARFAAKYKQHNAAWLERYGRPPGDLPDSMGGHAIYPYLDNLTADFPAGCLETAATLSPHAQGVALDGAKPFSLQTPRVSLTPGRYLVLFHVLSLSSERDAALILDANGRLGTPLRSRLATHVPVESTLSLEAELFVRDDVSFRLTVCRGEGLVLRKISLLPLEPLSFFSRLGPAEGFVYDAKRLGLPFPLRHCQSVPRVQRERIGDYHADMAPYYPDKPLVWNTDELSARLSLKREGAKKLIFTSTWQLRTQLFQPPVLTVAVLPRGFWQRLGYRLGLVKPLVKERYALEAAGVPTQLLPIGQRLRHTFVCALPQGMPKDSLQVAASLSLQ